MTIIYLYVWIKNVVDGMDASLSGIHQVFHYPSQLKQNVVFQACPSVSCGSLTRAKKNILSDHQQNYRGTNGLICEIV